ncbi:MAG: hypothetical protein UV58_C0003G0030 [Candidatus Wolfebacteria bacterium GW2011_GWC1_43_10]|uniref:Uncharacterized protein n=1 Tax=Candidatus Wolfebacteria bacterium GW2011_GWC1_43_10 TaxID=1619011 RepID=A0A0G1EIU9_9BACT|nr:MAG: hypothetical protein UV58_C0003G0030 [Candidatus Wolfebacteria bacterium GW2011_GWC1_43_10]
MNSNNFQKIHMEESIISFSSGILEVTRLVVIVLDVVFFLFFIYALFKVIPYRPKFVRNPEKYASTITARKDSLILKEWGKILLLFKKGTPEAFRLSVIAADSLVDQVLKNMGLVGEHFADRLSRLGGEEMRNIDGVWEAHRLRNDLVHTPHLGISLDDTKKTLRDYYNFLKELGALD